MGFGCVREQVGVSSDDPIMIDDDSDDDCEVAEAPDGASGKAADGGAADAAADSTKHDT